nr:copia protein [Tanacetum cinerariifolium]
AISKTNKGYWTVLLSEVARLQVKEKPKKILDALKDPWVRPIGTKWVLKNKKDERGIVIRNKARLVAQGHTQEEGIDYEEVFAPVARIEAIRLFLAYASFMGFTLYQMDVKSSFLYGTIGFQDLEFPDRVYKVKKIRLYCRGKENGVNILKSIDEGPYQIGTVRETLAESTKGAPQFGPKRSRVYSDLTSEEKDRYNANTPATNILLQGLPKDIYTLINHYTDAKDI